MRWEQDEETVAIYALSERNLVEGSLLPQGLALALEMHRMDGCVLERYEDETRGVIVFRARRARQHERAGFEVGDLLLRKFQHVVGAVDKPEGRG